ncbi:MAG: hypothetical protein ACXVRH_07290 [Thermoleophilaceae bacterium]
MFGLRSAQGRLDEMVETIAQSVTDYPAYRVFGCLLASIYCELGDEARCREAFELVAAGDCAGLPRDEEWLFGMTLLAPVCAFLGDEVRALSLHDLMSPYADRNALSVPDLSTGAVSRALGVVAGVAGRAEQAAAHFEHALEMNARMGTAPWLARTQHEYAALLASGDAAGWARADGLLSLAIENYRRVGMGSWARDAEALQRTLSADGGQVEPG